MYEYYTLRITFVRSSDEEHWTLAIDEKADNNPTCHRASYAGEGPIFSDHLHDMRAVTDSLLATFFLDAVGIQTELSF